MKTALFSLCYLDGVDKSNSSRLERNVKYLQYYWPLREELGFDRIFLADNCSSVRNLANLAVGSPAPFNIQAVEDGISIAPLPGVQVLRFEEHLSYGSTFPKTDPRAGYDYPYCWRGFGLVPDLFELGYDKVLVIDSDGFVLSPRLAHWLRDLKKGWATLWCPKYQFPDASIQAITRESYYNATQAIRPWEPNVGKVMELVLPFSIVEKSFVADRFGENREPVRPDMDFYGQAPFDLAMKYRGKTL